MRPIGIILARGGSKRIPRKNIRDFAGKPMLAWPIAAARDSGLFDRIIVSTDDPEIAEAAVSAGAEVPFIRPAELSDGHSGTLEVMGHAIRWAQAAGWRFDSACCLYATAAFTTANDLRSASDLHGEGWDYVFAAGRYLRPAQRAFVRRDDGSMALMFPDHALTRSQDLDPSFYDAGQFYVGSTDAWLAQRPIYGDRTAFIELPHDRALDIDTPEDWAIAEAHFAKWKRQSA